MDYLKEIIEAIKPILKNYGMKKQANNWFYENESIIKIFNIQKSMYGKQVYLNAGIKLKKIENDLSLTIPGSHIGTRFDNLIDNNILDFESNITINKRSKAFIELLISNPYDFFTLKGSDDDLRKFIKDSNTLAVFKIAKEYLNI